MYPDIDPDFVEALTLPFPYEDKNPLEGENNDAGFYHQL
jgi:hypothetical protein